MKIKILNIAHGIGMNINNILGSGIVTTPGVIWKAIKSPYIVLLLWLIGGIASITGALTYVELGAMHKVSGGEAKYLHTAFPEPGFMWSYVFSFVNILATRVIAAAILLTVTVYHMLLSNKWTNYINQTLTVIKLITYSIIAVAGIYRLVTNWSLSRINWQQSLSGSADITDYSTSILLILFSYDGWNSLNYSLDEYIKPEENLIYSNTISVGITMTLYLLVNVAFVSVIPGEIVTNINDETIVATFFHQLFGSQMVVRIFTGLVVLSIIGTASSQVWSGSRVIVVVAQLNFFPIYSDKLKIMNEKFTPVNALLAQFIWCSFIIIFVGTSVNITSYTLFSALSMYSYWIFYFATGIGLLVIRYKQYKQRQKKQEEQLENNNDNENSSDLYNTKRKHFKAPIPIILIFVLTGFCILVFSFVGNYRVQKLLTIFISYGLLLIAIILWAFWYSRLETHAKKHKIYVTTIISESSYESKE